jgi:flagellar basal body-associated protein FliL
MTRYNFTQSQNFLAAFVSVIMLLMIVISVIYLLHFQHLRGSDSKKHKNYMNCHAHEHIVGRCATIQPKIVNFCHNDGYRIIMITIGFKKYQIC